MTKKNPPAAKVVAPEVETPAAVPAQVAAPEVEILPAAPAPVQVGIAKVAPSSELLERMSEVRESLESFSDLKLPVISFKEGFIVRDGEEPVESFEGVIVYTKESNVYFEGRYRPGEAQAPRCMSLDGKVPCVADPISPSCKECPLNQYKSAKDGDGKACKNTRPTFIVTDGAVIPRVLRVPPTSLPFIKSFALSCAADYGAYLNVLTRFTVFKKSESQTHWNIRCSVVRRLTPEEKANMKAIQEAWMPTMRESDICIDVQGASYEAAERAAPPVDDASGMQY